MASIDLNIIQRGATSDFNWTAEPGRITAGDLGSIGEQRTDSSGALNALPTPFARFYIFKEAFRRVLEEKNEKGKKTAGKAYERLVSNCLDVFELLFNKKYHENHWKSEKRKIVIKEWNYDSDSKSLNNSVPILGRAVQTYFDDLNEKKLFFIILVEDGKEILLATSSPMTGFITPPDLDIIKDDEKSGASFAGKLYNSFCEKPLKKKNGGKYFYDIKLFGERSPEFKNYMYNYIFGEDRNDKFRELRSYIKAFEDDSDIKTDWTNAQLEDIYSNDNNELVVNGISIKESNDFDSVNYFADAVLRVPFRLSSENFKTLSYVNDRLDRNYDYLLPLSAQALSVIGTNAIIVECKQKTKATDITLTLNGKEFKKTFREEGEALKSGDGKIVCMDTAKINLDIALFPNVLSVNESENNYFKVLVSAFDDNDRRTFTVENLSLDFYKGVNGQYQKIEVADDATFKNGARRAVVRSKQDKLVKCGTMYYEVFNTTFDVILATAKIDSKEYTFALFPNWRRATQSAKKFKYAIDLGTSNTYISCIEVGADNQPQQLTMNTPMVSYLHEKNNSKQKNQVSCWEDNTPNEFKDAFKTEFVPPFIDGEAYKFPIRTALCFTGEDTSRLSLFDNSNIAFFYEKSKPIGNQRVITNIKWSADDKTLRVFIRELLLIIKADILMKNASISNTSLVWFYPLSLKDPSTLERIWAEEAKLILNLEQPLERYTESEAPYYYFNKEDRYRSVESVAIVDIGGGSTDFVYFQNGNPKIANSVHFGCDVLWGNAFDGFRNSRKNGIFNKYKTNVTFESENLRGLNTLMIENTESTTQDIINFWISNNAETKIADKMRKDFSYVFAYHFTAVIYYLASMLKANDFSHPRSITFSGNGSRYIDQYLTSNIDILTEITNLIMSKVYSENIADIQIELPDIRKECTCYGGLYHGRDSHPEPIIYYGNGKKETCLDVKALAIAFDKSIKNEVFNAVKAMNEIYLVVLSLLTRKGAIENPLDINKIREKINADIMDTLNSKFQTEILDKYTELEQYKDTLFFIPVISALLNLTNYS